MTSVASASGEPARAVGRHVPHLYAPGPWSETRIVVPDRTRDHLEKVLRFTEAKPVTYTNGAGAVGTGVYEIGSIARGAETTESARPHAVSIAVSPPRSVNRARFIVEKLAELGVARLIWLQTKYTQARAPRTDKSQAWAQASLEQSRGVWLMKIEESTSVAEIERYGDVIVADPGGLGIADIGRIQNPVLCIGPEGGFAPGETPERAPVVRLGRSVLRTETAAIAGAVLLIDKSSRSL